ncbi:MAG TPA: tetratricopeptide repeat protein [Opitutaceae bacterium]|nr:tetratricopeptide repeat protein [Opitutaceae bacterium]
MASPTPPPAETEGRIFARPGPADLWLGFVCLAVIAFYAWTVAPSRSDWGNVNAHGAYYNLLVDGLGAGQLNLKVDVPPDLARLADPYDPEVNALYRTRFHLHDTSFYRGKIYIYYGPTPALLLFGPYHWLTGEYLFNKHAVLAFAALGFLASVWLLRAGWRRYFSGTPGWLVVLCALALGVANSVPQLLRIPGICEVAIACAYAFTMVACVALWYALHSAEHARRWLVLASITFGLAVGARPSVLFGAVVLLVPALLAWRRARGEAWRLLAAAVIPLLLIGVGLALYNHARFGDIFEFGQRYQLAGDRQDNARHFSPAYLWFNFRLYFLQWVPWRNIFPYVQEIAVPALPAGHAPVESAYGILTNTPVTLFAIAAFVVARRRAREAGNMLGAMLASLGAIFATSAQMLALFYGTVMRYQVEFHPTVTLLGCLGIVGLAASWRAEPRTARAWRPLSVAALAFSIGFSVLLSIRMLAEEYNKQGVQLAQEGKNPAAIGKFEEALRVKADFMPALINAGMVQLGSGHAAAAVSHFQAATVADPRSFDAHNGLGRALAAAGKPAEAAERFREAVRLQPRAGVAHVNLATMLLQIGQAGEAVKHYEIAIALGVDLPGLPESLAMAKAQAAQPPAPR